MKNIFKKIIILMTLITIFIPSVNNRALAYSGGLLDKKTVFHASSLSTKEYPVDTVTDGNLANGPTLNSLFKYVWYEFPSATTITGYQLQASVGASIELHVIKTNGTDILISSAPKFNGVNTAITTISDVKKIYLKDSSSNSFQINEFDVFGSIYVPVVHTELTSFSATQKYNQVSLNWSIPIDNTHFVGTKIYRNGEYFATVGNNSFTDTTVNPDTEYSYKITAIYDDGFETEGLSKTIKTDPIKKVTDIKVEPKYNRVNISWVLPNQEGFQHINIYREEIAPEPSLLEKIFSLSESKVYAAESTKIFETNGTYFNDLTVTPKTQYEYTLTTQTMDGIESEGVTVEAITPEEPKPVIEGGELSKNDDSNYLVSWDKPTTGKIKISIDGKDYLTTDAATQQIVIPKEDIKTNILGEPSGVKLTPIGEFGTVGDSISLGKQPDNLKIPFSIEDLLISGNSLLFILSPLVLLSLSFMLFPKFRKLIFSSFQNKNNEENEEKNRRFTSGDKELRKSKTKEPRETGEENINPRNDPKQKISSIKEDKQPRIPRQPKISTRTTRKTRDNTRETRQPRIRETRKRRESR